jgi:NAD dependent epimerase/dehydratase family enzyme
MTMSPDSGGVFDRFLRLVRFGFGGPMGSGQQYLSWIHELDFVRAVEFLIANERISGVVNVASPNPVTNADFLRSLRDVSGMNIGFSLTDRMVAVGAFFLRTETELILKSRRVVPGRLTREGFTFVFPEWPGAARDLVGRWRNLSSRKGE